MMKSIQSKLESQKGEGSKGEGEGLHRSFLKNHEKSPNFKKICLDCVHLSVVKFLIQKHFEESLGEKTPNFFLSEPFFHVCYI